MNGSNTYKERNSIKINQGEEIFLAWCKEQNLKVTRLGFDEKGAPVDRFYDLPILIRNLPDFIVTSETKATLVNVKGSLNFKESEYLMLDSFIENFSRGGCPLYYVFALKNNMFWRKVESVKTAYEEASFEDKWPDGKTYRRLELCNPLDF